ncbi:MAG: polysulfide reductase NrfD, partial [Bacteroidetes bacterium]|nr:polysulfide reductase NrfD [Bacteroidota bacterium]
MAQTVNTTNQEFETIKQDLLEPVARERNLAGKLWIRFLLVVILLGLFSYLHQLFTGLGVTAMRDYSAWGIYIAHFVFLVAVSLVGSLVTAVLKLLNIKWATPLTRISEIIAVTAVALAAVTIVIDMGRPDRLLNVFLNGRLSSPILWDITVVNTYLVISLILLYIPMIPDLALMRDNLSHAPKWQHKLYKTL